MKDFNISIFPEYFSSTSKKRKGNDYADDKLDWNMTNAFFEKKKKNIAAVSNSRINIGDWSILKYFVESIFAIDKVWKTFQKKFLQIRVNIVKKDSGNFPSTKHLFL